MIDEHRAILGAVREFAVAAETEAELMVHAQLEEDVLYPAAILVGEYVKARV